MDKKLIVGLVVLAVLAGGTFFLNALVHNRVVVGYNNGYAPDQPIPFSHQIHAGINKIDCRYCHVGVEISRHATVPSLNICMNCHLTITPKSAEGKKYIEVLRNAYNNNKPIFWKKVNMLPDHVKFNHAPHILKGKQCSQCHGAVETMDKVEQHESLSMGFCVNCHRKEHKNYLTNCGTCHY